MKLEDIQSDDRDFLSLVKFSGKKIKDITFYLSGQFGGVTLNLCELVFEDDTVWDFEGEHDIAYLTDRPEFRMPDEETLEALYNEENE